MSIVHSLALCACIHAESSKVAAVGRIESGRTKRFLKALEIASAEERAAWLNETCGTKTPLRDRIEALLRQHDQADGFLEKPVDPQLGASDFMAETSVGRGNGEQPTLEQRSRSQSEIIGPYKLLQKIGEGGMGTV